MFHGDDGFARRLEWMIELRIDVDGGVAREHFDELNASDALDCISDHSFSFESDELDFGYGEESEDEEDLEL